jgi:tetratricopeptide (TPR) repeat protein
MNAFQQCLQLRKQHNDRQGQIKVLNNICNIYTDLGEHQKTRQTLQEAISIAVEIDDKHLEGALLNNLGSVLMDLGDYNAALICYQKNLAVSQSIDDEEEIGKAHLGLGAAYQHLNKYNEAVEHFTKANLILGKFGYPPVLPELLNEPEEMAAKPADAAVSLEFLLTTLELSRKANDYNETALTLCLIADIYMSQKDFDNTVKYLEECLPLLAKVEDRKLKSMVFFKLGLSYSIKEQYDKAIDCFEKNMALHKLSGTRLGEAVMLKNIAECYEMKGQPEKHLYYMLEAYTIAAEENDVDGIYILGTSLGAILCDRYPEKYLQLGLWLFEQAWEIGLQTPDISDLDTLRSMIDDVQQLLAKQNK